MSKPERYVVCFVLLATFAITSIAVEDSRHQNDECDPKMFINSCTDHERCEKDEKTKKYVCLCQINYVREMPGGKCVGRPTTVPPRPESTTEKLDGTTGSSGSSVAVGLLVPTFLIVLGVLGFCAARRYRLLPCRRNLYGNVLVTRDDDDDDPPIA